MISHNKSVIAAVYLRLFLVGRHGGRVHLIKSGPLIEPVVKCRFCLIVHGFILYREAGGQMDT